MTPAEAAAAIEAIRARAVPAIVWTNTSAEHALTAPRSVRLRQAFDRAALDAGEPARFPVIIHRSQWNAIARAKRTEKRKAQRRARRITRLHRK